MFHIFTFIYSSFLGTVPDRSNLTGNAFLERLGNAKGNAKGTLKNKRSVLRGTRSWEHVLEAQKIQWNRAKDDA